MNCRLDLLKEMFRIREFCRCRSFTQAHILEGLQDVSNRFSKNSLPSQYKQVLLISCSLKQNLSVHDFSKVVTTFDHEQNGFPHKQRHLYCHNNNAAEGEVSEDMQHIDDDALDVECNMSVESKVEEIDVVPYVLNKKKSRRVRDSPHYPLMNMGKESKTFTRNFEKSEKLLQSLNLPTFELPHYPDIQEMSEEDLHLCINRLNEIGIHVVFSLFLIQRIATEIELDRTMKRAVSLSHTKNRFKLPNGKYRLASLQAVSLYLKLCRILENPELDLYKLINDLSSVSINEPLYTVVSKIQQLRSVGATPQDILSNLTLLKGHNFFKEKIQVYKNLFLHTKPSFPVNLFLSTTMTEFREKLQLGKDFSVIAHHLGVSLNDFVTCWGFKSLATSSLIRKIHMLLRAGISQQDLFNNISTINRLSLNKLQLRLESVLKSTGHSISLYELILHEDHLDFNDSGTVQRDWTSDDQSDSGMSLLVDMKKIHKENAHSKGNSPKVERKVYQKDTSKMWRMDVFKLIAHHLQLNKKSLKAMYQANVSVDSTHIQDITQNLDYLISKLQFTKEQISACPLILAHPHKDLCRVTEEVDSLLAQHYTWLASGHKLSTQGADVDDISLASILPSSESVQTWSSSSSSLSSLSSPLSHSSHVQENRIQPSNFRISNNENGMRHPMDFSFLLTDRIIHLNILQYFLEKQTGFSLLSTVSIDFRK